MNRRRSLAVSLSGVIFLTLGGCALLPWAKGALDVADVACILSAWALPDQKIQEICKITNALAPDMRKLLDDKRAAMAKAGVCGPNQGDAGTDDAAALEQ